MPKLDKAKKQVPELLKKCRATLFYAGISISSLNTFFGGNFTSQQSGLTCKDVHPVHSVFASSFFFGGAAEAIKTCGNADILQADLRQVLNEFCLRQSATDSTGPEIDVPAGILGEFDIQGDIGQVKAPARLQHPHDFSKTAILLRKRD